MMEPIAASKKNDLDPYKKRFCLRAQAVFYARLALFFYYQLVMILPGFPCSGILSYHRIYSFVPSFCLFLALSSWLMAKSTRFGRWIHFLTLSCDVLVHIAIVQSTGGFKSPFLAIHPLLTATFLLLFHSHIVLAVPLASLPLLSILEFTHKGEFQLGPIARTLLLYAILDTIVIYFTHYSLSKEEQQALEVIKLEQKLRSLAVDQERLRLAREFHDGVGARLSGIILQAEYAQSQTSDETILLELEELKSVALEAVSDMRRSIAVLRNEFDLSEQIHQIYSYFEGRNQFVISFKEEGNLQHIPYENQITYCRILYEALNNILKHAKSTNVDINISCNNSGILLSIKDNGIGFNSDIIPKYHYGIRNMQERAKKIQARFIIDSKPGAGTHILLEDPWPNCKVSSNVV